MVGMNMSQIGQGPVAILDEIKQVLALHRMLGLRDIKDA